MKPARLFGGLLLAGAAVSVSGAALVHPAARVSTASANAAALPTITVYKSPSCGCCGAWIKHLRDSGFTVAVHDMDDLSEIKSANGVAPALQSCHTAVVGRYVIEGHVPADVIKRALKEQPKIAGLAVPGMVTGSPGMEGPNPQHYDIVAWTAQGKTAVYAHR